MEVETRRDADGVVLYSVRGESYEVIPWMSELTDEMCEISWGDFHLRFARTDLRVGWAAGYSAALGEIESLWSVLRALSGLAVASNEMNRELAAEAYETAVSRLPDRSIPDDIKNNLRSLQ